MRPSSSALYIQSGALQDIASHLPAVRDVAAARKMTVLGSMWGGEARGPSTL